MFGIFSRLIGPSASNGRRGQRRSILGGLLHGDALAATASVPTVQRVCIAPQSRHTRRFSLQAVAVSLTSAVRQDHYGHKPVKAICVSDDNSKRQLLCEQSRASPRCFLSGVVNALETHANGGAAAHACEVVAIRDDRRHSR